MQSRRLRTVFFCLSLLLSLCLPVTHFVWRWWIEEYDYLSLFVVPKCTLDTCSVVVILFCCPCPFSLSFGRNVCSWVMNERDPSRVIYLTYFFFPSLRLGLIALPFQRAGLAVGCATVDWNALAAHPFVSDSTTPPSGPVDCLPGISSFSFLIYRARLPYFQETNQPNKKKAFLFIHSFFATISSTGFSSISFLIVKKLALFLNRNKQKK